AEERARQIRGNRQGQRAASDRRDVVPFCHEGLRGDQDHLREARWHRTVQEPLECPPQGGLGSTPRLREAAVRSHEVLGAATAGCLQRRTGDERSLSRRKAHRIQEDAARCRTEVICPWPEGFRGPCYERGSQWLDSTHGCQ